MLKRLCAYLFLLFVCILILFIVLNINLKFIQEHKYMDTDNYRNTPLQTSSFYYRAREPRSG